jgi:acyl-CoA-binding protein
LVNEGVTQKDAEQKYVDLVEELKKNYGFDE